MTDFGPAIDRLRETAKYLIGAFAAVAALLIGTSPLSGLGALELNYRLAVALLAALVALVVVAIMVALALPVLTPKSIPFDDIPQKPEFARQRRQIEREDTHLFHGDHTSVATLFAKRAELQAQERTARENGRPWKDQDENAVVLSALRTYGTLIQNKMVYLVIEQNFKRLVRYLGILFPIISIALIAFTWAVGIDRNAVTDLEHPVIITLPDDVDNKLAFKKAGYPDKCLAEPQQVVVFRERSRWSAEGVMMLGDPSCKPARVTLSDRNRILSVQTAI
jgi:hypothetical protein